MNIEKIKVGLLRCNCYLLEKNHEYLLIDPGDDYDKIKEFINGKNIVGVLLTHNHFDHVACADNLKEDYNLKIYTHKYLKEGNITIGNFNFEVIYTNGHTMDCITFYFKDEHIMFTGDFLFKETVGRCDLLESNWEEMKMSISKIKNYSDDILIYPGHGISSDLGHEKKYNPYF
jgi:glyoxylase-like metal-dependent hydrolase (beta-lactamase superfamily II)